MIQLQTQREISAQPPPLVSAGINMEMAPHCWHQTSGEVLEKRISFSRGAAGGMHRVQDDEGRNIKGQPPSGAACLTLKCEAAQDKRPVPAPALSTGLVLALPSCSSSRRWKTGARWKFHTRAPGMELPTCP